MRKTKVKIVISGYRACGKTTVATHIRNLLEGLGAEVVMKGTDWTAEAMAHRKKHQENLPFCLDKIQITIQERTPQVHSDSGLKKQFKHAQEAVALFGGWR